MQNLCMAILDGNLTADPESKTTKSDKSLTTFRVALNHEWGSKDGAKQVSFIPVECWDRLAENCANYLRKGSRVTITGNLREDRWTDNEGRKRNALKIVARSVRFDSAPPGKDKDPEENKTEQAA